MNWIIWRKLSKGPLTTKPPAWTGGSIKLLGADNISVICKFTADKLLSKREAELFPVPPYRPFHHSIPTLGKQARSLKQISYFVLSSVILNIDDISCL